MSSEEIKDFILRTSKGQLIELLRVSTSDELKQTILTVIHLMD